MDTAVHKPANGRLGRVLVVDDEENIRKLVLLSLTKAGYEVVEAGNGAQAIEHLNAGDNPLMVDAILCDIRMPEINGVEAIQYFCSQYPSVPIVVLTGYPDIGLAVDLLQQGVKDFLVKPVSKETLLESISKAVDGHVILNGQFTA